MSLQRKESGENLFEGKRTKIVATIGPSSEDRAVLRKMIKNGLNVCRLNFSHNSHEWHKNTIKTIRSVAEEVGSNIGILADLQGPRIRVETNVEIKAIKGREILVSDVSHKKTIADFSSDLFFLDCPGVIEKLEVGKFILIQDGTIKLEVIKKEKNLVRAVVIDGGIIKDHKGVNLPDADLDIDVITEKDKRDLKFVLENGVNFVALSFVKNGNDIIRLKKMMTKMAGTDKNLPMVVSKIERTEAIENLDDILDQTDAVMVARGDLGTETSPGKLAVYQKTIVTKSLKKVKPVIMATEMLDSMIERPRPTRAEISDVSNAVIDHTDAVMLSGETAGGKYPIETIKVMNEIISSIEESPYDDIYRALRTNIDNNYATIIRGAYELAKSFDAKAIIAISTSGFTAKLISHFRPERKIIVATNNKATHGHLSLVWGVDSYYFNDKNLDNLIDMSIKEAKKEKKLKKGDQVVVILGKSPSKEKMRLIGIREIA